MNLREHPPFLRRILRALGRRFYQWADGSAETRIERSGELWLVRELLQAHILAKTGRPFVAFDGGANAGGYTRLILQETRRLGGDSVVHAFEPSPGCLALLQQAFGAESTVRIVGAALTDRPGAAALFGGGGGSTLASLVPRPILGADKAETVQVPLLCLADYLVTQAIPRVDLLKLDVEGSELAALRGLGGQLRPETVDVIQFEYGGTAVDAGITLREIYALLTARGYVVARLFPRALEVRVYEAWMENYAYANYVALAPRWRKDGPAALTAR